MSYSTLSKADLHDLRVERLRFLECEHVRCMLLLEENVNDLDARKALKDVERRIALHHGILMPEPAEDTDATKAVPDDEGSDALSRT